MRGESPRKVERWSSSDDIDETGHHVHTSSVASGFGDCTLKERFKEFSMYRPAGTSRV